MFTEQKFFKNKVLRISNGQCLTNRSNEYELNMIEWHSKTIECLHNIQMQDFFLRNDEDDEDDEDQTT